jgi:RNA polymerase sigma-70 factor, ECF subfamily
MSQEDRSDTTTWFQDEVMRLLPDLLAGARGMASSSADAEDLVAESVARAWEKLGDLEERDRFRGWLFCIMKNQFLGRVRRRDARPTEVPLSEEEGHEPGFSLFDQVHQPFLLWWGNTEQDFLNNLLKEDLQQAIEGLPAPYRTVVTLADVRGFRYAEIAEALEIPVGTVRSRLARGRSRLQEELWTHAVDAGLRQHDPPEGGVLE